MKVKVRLFAILADRVGADRVEVEVPNSATVAEALGALARIPGLEAVSGGSARLAVNREYAGPEVHLAPGDELALIPPVSGGAPDAVTVSRSDERVLAAVTSAPLQLSHLLRFVASEHAGALVSFQGLPRDVPALDYEAYPEMAVGQIWSILTGCVTSGGLCAAAAAHRVGTVNQFEPSIIVAVSAAHRGPAFAGARDALDAIKAQAPIWKVEVHADGVRRRVAGAVPR